ncbi:T9SS type A sorting domain-containing protein [Pontibacter korlensis]|uniref:Secretion system C-terminal sorting domain-containing protein n=1 Tax=Pontibacter korlensis TaxID=400092 RepID=A0A0E3UWF8_9BACT|nr:T9SS type A sorting domain-containing protein [Pontibacter korlensis]AKD03372.1 hypothetical protein PKOR_09875 [Pontibacter korlensis]
MKTKLLLSALALLLLPMLVQATHLYSGYISYTVDEHNPLQFNFTFTLYTNHFSQAEDPEVEVKMGDGNTVVLPRTSITPYSYTYDRDIFHWSYTYATPGNYTVTWIGESRNHGIINFPSPSDQVAMHVSTAVNASRLITNYNSVALAGVPIFEAYAGEPMIHNLLTYDADGDQLLYELVTPKTENANSEIITVPGYQFPEGLTVSKYGELSWVAPNTVGQYVIALQVTEQRNGAAIGTTVVDIMYNVSDSKEKPELTLLNKDRLPLRDDGAVQTWPDQPLKLEYYLQKNPNQDHLLHARFFSEIDTLDLAAATLAVRDTVDGFAVSLTLTPSSDMERPSPYLIGLRGRSSARGHSHEIRFFVEDDWEFTYLYVGEQQPTSAGDDLAKAGFKLYPNPVADRFVVEAPDLPSMYLQLRDATGKKLSVLRLEPGRNTLVKPGSLASGLYFYTISSRSKPVGSGKLVVR